MYKQIATRARFMDPIQHDEKLTDFSGVRTDWPIEGIVFNNDGCNYDVGDDGDFTMHSIEFHDGSRCYFERLTDGTLSHFMADAYTELRDGLLVVSARSVYEDAKMRESRGTADFERNGGGSEHHSDHAFRSTAYPRGRHGGF
ncbi:hypothetical protein [Bradyrhizobium sp. SYSU BS000235]|uniref:hypothetical protein n=1 Tax=Bradyrhizobium sp. SYSU BS000235 TaxID=3411332 RepID=UPI003C77FF75